MNRFVGWSLVMVASAVIGSGLAHVRAHDQDTSVLSGSAFNSPVQQNNQREPNPAGLYFPTQYVSRHLRIRLLPSMAPTNTVHLADGNLVSAGDDGVMQNVVKNAASIMEQTSFAILQTQIGQTPQNAHIVLFSKRKTYAAALLRAGVPQDEIRQMVGETGGITVGTDVWIPLYANTHPGDLENVLTHELTHVVFNQIGIGNALPTWVNEGTAWDDGLAAENRFNPRGVQALAATYNQQMSAAKTLLPLSATEQDILNAPYNVEWEDYLAVQRLIQQDGVSKYEAFLRDIKSEGVDASFQITFGTSMEGYESQFLQDLQNGSIPLH